MGRPTSPGVATVVIAATLGGCTALMDSLRGADGPHDDGGTGVSQAELQQDVQRFSSDFISRTVNAMRPLEESDDSAVRSAAVMLMLRYASSSIDIATQAMPELSVLDMVVFTTLSRSTVDRHWGPQVFGAPGAALATELAALETEAWDLSRKILNEHQRDELRAVIDDWIANNPDNLDVEIVRLQDFASVTAKIQKERARQAVGILASVRAVTRTTDHAVLLGERAIFLANRVPFLIRLQARVGAHEVLDDTALRLASADALFSKAQTLQPMIGDLTALTQSASAAAREATALADALRPLVDELKDVDPEAARRGLDRLDVISERSLRLVEELRALAPGGDSDVAAHADGLVVRVDTAVRRWLWAFLGGGAALILLFWLSWAVAHRVAAPRPPPPAGAE